MPHQGESKTCKMCRMGIPAEAKKCPYCLHWQYRLTMIMFHPAFGVVFGLIPIMAIFIVFMVSLNTIFSKGEPFQNYAGQIAIVESKMEFGQEQSGPIVAVVGKIKNASSVDWKDLCIQVEFFDDKNSLIDADQQSEYRSPKLPAGQEIGFKISFPRPFPEKKYVRYNVRVISAKDEQHRF